MSRRAWTIFTLVQVVGLTSAWLQHPPSAASSFLWGTGFVLLFPGDVLGAWTVEKLFWQSCVSLSSMNVISAVFWLAINAGVWWSVARVWRAIRARRSAPAPS
ncbi:MAG TPA: hypothetical protein VFA68_00040 [Terriglobales bacterium]|jgi:hypothetical protein|nr:hypothetical protein [Terriglobales bacterium]